MKQESHSAHNNLLCGVDGSDASLHAFKEGVRLAGRGGRLVAVSVAPQYNGDLRLLGVQDAGKLIRQPCDAALSRCEATAREAGVEVKTICALGEPYARLIELAEEENSDLIVIGAKGLTSLKYSLIRERCPQGNRFYLQRCPGGAKRGESGLGSYSSGDGFFGQQRRCGKPGPGTGFSV